MIRLAIVGFVISWPMIVLPCCLSGDLPFWASFPMAGACTIVLLIIGYRMEKQEKKDKEENKSNSTDYILKRYENSGVLGGTNLDRFFIECALAECSDFSKEKNLQKAKLLANKYNLSYPNGIPSLFEIAQNAHEKMARINRDKQRQERLAAMSEAEKKELEKLLRYSEYYGREKRSAMLTDEIARLKQEAADLEADARVVVSMGQEKESDWATMGGIANGLAGPAAGLATAMELQAQNASIRAKNEAYKQTVMPASIWMKNKAMDKEREAKKLSTELHKLQEKLISDIPTDAVMNKLEISDVQMDITETGTCKISARIREKNPLFLYDDVPVRADGTILAHIQKGGREIGAAKLVLPMCGVLSHPLTVSGMALFCGDPHQQYTVTFSGYKLWLIEQ